MKRRKNKVQFTGMYGSQSMVFSNMRTMGGMSVAKDIGREGCSKHVTVATRPKSLSWTVVSPYSNT